MRDLIGWIALTAMLVLFGLAAPVLANETASHGGTGCTLVRTPGQIHVAELRCTNRLVASLDQTQDVLEVEGVSLVLVIDHLSGEVPDRFSVVLPANLQAIPAEMDLLEDASGTILIYEWQGM